MTQSIADAFKCNQCGAQYISEKELQEHQQAVHHAAGHAPARTEHVDEAIKAKTESAQDISTASSALTPLMHREEALQSGHG